MKLDILNLKSNLRRKLLTLFFTNPEKSYYIRQLERLIGFSAGNISNELRRLNRDHLFITEEVGNSLFYRLNGHHPIYNELRSIITKTVGVEGGLKTALQVIPGISCSFIFGSFARGEEYQLSDIDLFIIGCPDMDKLSGAIHQQEDLLQREINYHIYSEKDWIEKIVEKDSFILNLKEQNKIFLIGNEKCL
ncbi:MAG: nucleotidyltransferase domain-containing protein [Candidatus Eremiobacteraeota bacterium]|nr:nucleotidyltransferase domain-containing protein [Candidatus Eremiobacteraeota bacterium]